MLKELLKKWKINRIIKRKEVTYSFENQRISIGKGKQQINLSAVFKQVTNEENCPNGYIMEISGNPLVADSYLVREIWEVLWNNPVFPKKDEVEKAEEIETEKNEDIEAEKVEESDIIFFKDVKPVSNPNKIPMRIEVVLPTLYH